MGITEFSSQSHETSTDMQEQGVCLHFLHEESSIIFLDFGARVCGRLGAEERLPLGLREGEMVC